MRAPERVVALPSFLLTRNFLGDLVLFFPPTLPFQFCMSFPKCSNADGLSQRNPSGYQPEYVNFAQDIFQLYSPLGDDLLPYFLFAAGDDLEREK